MNKYNHEKSLINEILTMKKEEMKGCLNALENMKNDLKSRVRHMYRTMRREVFQLYQETEKKLNSKFIGVKKVQRISFLENLKNDKVTIKYPRLVSEFQVKNKFIDELVSQFPFFLDERIDYYFLLDSLSKAFGRCDIKFDIGMNDINSFSNCFFRLMNHEKRIGDEYIHVFLHENNLRKFSSILKNVQCLYSFKLMNIEKCYMNDFPSLFYSVTASSNTLREIEFFDCNFTRLQCEDIAKVLTNCKDIRTLKLCKLKEANLGVVHITFSVFRASNKINEVRIVDCDLNSWLTKILGAIFLSKPQLSIIDLSSNDNMSSGMGSICKGLQASKDTLKQFNLTNCNLNFEQYLVVKSLLMKCKNIQSFTTNLNFSISEPFDNTLQNGSFVNGLYTYVKENTSSK